MNKEFSLENEKGKIKMWLLLFISALILSGITAFAPVFFLHPFIQYVSTHSSIPFYAFVIKANDGLTQTGYESPFLFYGYDWLAFAHIIIAVLFIGPYREPVKNKWVIQFGIIACVLIVPFAMVMGQIRHIPFLWRLIDCSFGVIGVLPLIIIERKIKMLELGTPVKN